MKKLIFLSCLAGMTLFFNACAPAYVSTQPTYTEITPPPSPGNSHVWVPDNWMWSARARNYVHRDGYWVIPPNQGRTYQQGYWKTNKRGHRWISGRWQ